MKMKGNQYPIKGRVGCKTIWSETEEKVLREGVKKYGGDWKKIVAMLSHNGFGEKTSKQCRERWIHHLNPQINNSELNSAEEKVLFETHKAIGNKWVEIAQKLPGRSDNAVKNYFYSKVRKVLRRFILALRMFPQYRKLHLNQSIFLRLAEIKKMSILEIEKMEVQQFGEALLAIRKNKKKQDNAPSSGSEGLQMKRKETESISDREGLIKEQSFLPEENKKISVENGVIERPDQSDNFVLPDLSPLFHTPMMFGYSYKIDCKCNSGLSPLGLVESGCSLNIKQSFEAFKSPYMSSAFPVPNILSELSCSETNSPIQNNVNNCHKVFPPSTSLFYESQQHQNANCCKSLVSEEDKKEPIMEAFSPVFVHSLQNIAPKKRHNVPLLNLASLKN